MSEGFLGRWSRRKQEARQEQAASVTEKTAQPAMDSQVSDPRGMAPTTTHSLVEPVQSVPTMPVPTEADLPSVQAGGDVVAFMQSKVAPELRNKALKTLFSRPEFNVMDGLDIYIDDYNVFTPLEQSDIDKMALAKQLLSRPDLEVLPEETEISGAVTEAADVLPAVTDEAAPLPFEVDTIATDTPVTGATQSEFVQVQADKPELK
ncbi:DUF3306 domain-containing protein [Limnobacter humi]|uniref:DUF3306 domain-containing protein n=1 Tax=Limnobacter humi TaxID=1778671 RepID=A0ABT1WEU0_9BURK|nr:DUF3306 domain-containing protein [Limnobacter humi]MCQ8895904.1 DUF3306 domain-containing protein [Limnobacter humi]